MGCVREGIPAMLSRWFRFSSQLLSSLSKAADRVRPRFRPRLEHLEDREVPATTEAMIGLSPDAGGPPRIQINRPDGSRVTQFEVYGASFRGGVQVATGDVNGDQILEIFCAPGASGAPVIRSYDGLTLTSLRSIQVYDRRFTGG